MTPSAGFSDGARIPVRATFMIWQGERARKKSGACRAGGICVSTATRSSESDGDHNARTLGVAIHSGVEQDAGNGAQRWIGPT